ncbi:homoserine dehydrogenase [Lichenicola cladoniae]|uniref:Homoserine dehydrogenase n=1 Tax=Lichenicola cladoniae TaxID=1484109 RepID=A0A6M8HP98_9PROT|nr:homoserine dehydrogenase [Lichenicola cladoniae]NPD68402.1 homoserine dehydrogenase [Acetobacteraceae bacterium]QKE90110.1 homoserine dehydrogenase [Lichenicola cladoniae]
MNTLSLHAAAAPLRVGIAGLGTVGAGTVRLLRANAELIAARAGRPVVVTAVSARDRHRARGIDVSSLAWHDDALTLATDPDVDVVVELIGGSEGAARTLVETALSRGRPVVTANKALIAIHGAGLASAAERAGVALAFEAAVAGGIPVIKALREGLAADRLVRIGGILNGTCNYILTAMRETGRGFASVLEEAQALGYAETDPSTDVDGIDTAHKLAILAALAFGRPVDFDSVHIEGIRRIGAADIAFATELGYRIKLLGIARRSDQGVETRVHPCLVPNTAPIAQVEGVFNAVVAEGEFVGRVMLEGRGAGAGPTATAVVGDLIDIARGSLVPAWGAISGSLSKLTSVPMSACRGSFYLRLDVRDRPGVIAEITAVLRDCGVSLKSMLQHGQAPSALPDESVPIVLVTHETREVAMQEATARIAGLDVVVASPVMIRIEAG